MSPNSGFSWPRVYVGTGFPVHERTDSNSNYHNIYHVILDTIAMREEELHYSFFVLALSSPPASHNKENKRNPTLVLIAPV